MALNGQKKDKKGVGNYLEKKGAQVAKRGEGIESFKKKEERRGALGWARKTGEGREEIFFSLGQKEGRKKREQKVVWYFCSFHHYSICYPKIGKVILNLCSLVKLPFVIQSFYQ